MSIPAPGYTAQYGATNGIVFRETGEAVTWAGGSGQFVATRTSNTFRFTHTLGNTPSIGDVVTGGTSGATRTITAFVLENPNYHFNWVVTNGVAFVAAEKVTWGVNGNGLYAANLDTAAIMITHCSGAAPIIGDTVTGVTSGATRVISSWRNSTCGMKLVPSRISTANPVTEVEWAADTLNVGPDPTKLFRVNFTFISNLNGVSGGTFATNIPSFGFHPNSAGIIGAGNGSLIVHGAQASWGTQTDLFSITDFTSVLLWDNSAASYVDLTIPAKLSDPGNATHLHQAADILYMGHTEPRISPTVNYGAVTAPGGGGPIIVEYSNDTGGWTEVPGLVDGTNVLSSDKSIDFRRPSNWGTQVINGSPALYWVRVRLTSDAPVAAVAEYMRAHRRLDGVETTIYANNVVPNYRHFWIDIDGIGGTSSSIANGTSLITGPGHVVKYHAKRLAGNIINPPGVLFRNGLSGVAHDLLDSSDGTGYTKWELSNEIYAQWRTLGNFYIPSEFHDYIDKVLPFHHFTEWYTSNPAPGNQVNDNPVDIRYHSQRCFDGTWWYEMLSWKVDFVHSHAATAEYGFSAQVETGKIASVTTATTNNLCENTTSRYLWCGLTYENAMTGLPLATNGRQVFNIGNNYISGPQWRKAGTTYPYVMQEQRRNYIILMPASNAGVRACYVAPAHATYRLSGNFGKATSGTGLGTRASIVHFDIGNRQMITRHSATLTGAGNTDTPFTAGTSSSAFNTTFHMWKGDKVYFIVEANQGNNGFGETAFVLDVAWQPDPVPDFTGWGDVRGSPGDRAIRCPRCGKVGRELELVVDGVTKTKVCTDCYDPPPLPGNFRWPFRS